MYKYRSTSKSWSVRGFIRLAFDVFDVVTFTIHNPAFRHPHLNDHIGFLFFHKSSTTSQDPPNRRITVLFSFKTNSSCSVLSSKWRPGGWKERLPSCLQKKWTSMCLIYFKSTERYVVVMAVSTFSIGVSYLYHRVNNFFFILYGLSS